MRHKALLLALLVAFVASACGSRLPDRVLMRLDQQAAGRVTGGIPGAQGGDQAAGDAGLATGTTLPGGQAPGQVAGGGAGRTASGGGATQGPAAGGGQALTGGGATQCRATSGGEKGVTPNEIKVASIVTDSGPLPGATEGNYRGAAAYFAMVNAQGGVCGRKITIVKGDDGLDAGRARSEFERLEPQVLAFVGSLATADFGFMDELKATNVPWVGATVDPSGRSYPNVYPHTNVNLVHTGPFAYIKQAYPSVQNVGYLLSAVNGVRANSGGQEAALKRVGFNIAYRAEADVTAPDYTAHVINMRNDNVQFVFLWSFEINMTVRLVRNMRQQNWDPPVKMGNLTYNTKFVPLLGDLANGWKSDLTFLPPEQSESAVSPAMATFLTWNQRVFPNGQLDFFPVTGWGNAAHFVEALKKVGPDVTRQKLLDALNTVTQIDMGGLQPPTNPITGEPPACFVIVKVEGGKWVRERPADKGFECGVGEMYKYQ